MPFWEDIYFVDMSVPSTKNITLMSETSIIIHQFFTGKQEQWETGDKKEI